MSHILDSRPSGDTMPADETTDTSVSVLKADRRSLAALHRQVASITEFDVVARKGSLVEQWLSGNYGPAHFGELTEQVRSYRRPFGRGAHVFAGVDRRDGVLWIVRQHPLGDWETIWPR